jgi:ubiquinone/menaquinone biosynthesis C-methylase UbiE
MPKAEGHKWFAAFYTRLVKAETPKVKGLRKETLAGLSGRVLDLGCGPGANFEFFPDTVTEPVAADPDPYMLERARKRAAQLGRQIRIEQARAEELPYEDGSFDAVVCTLVLCTVDDPQRALREVARVLKPGGELRFFEHVRYENGPGALLQDIVVPVWRWVGAGCHPNRRTAREMRRAGFQIRTIRRVDTVPPVPPMLVVRPCILGSATPLQASPA